MTDKQIIIDGVDVSGCEFVFVEKDKKAKISCWCNKLNFLCKDNPSCYYKRLQRAEKQLAEDEEIQVDMRIKIDELKGLLSRKEQECERFKECLSQIQNAAISLTRQFDLLCAENEELKNFHINIVGVKKCEIRELVKYKRILTEIKAEMRKILMVGNGIDGKYRPVKNSSKQDCYQVLGKIQEILGTNQIKISEVKNE